MKFKLCLFSLVVPLATTIASATETNELVISNQRVISNVLRGLKSQGFNLTGISFPIYGKVRRTPSAAPQGEPEAVVPPEVLKKVPELIGRILDHLDKGEGERTTYPARLLYQLHFPFPNSEAKIPIQGTALDTNPQSICAIVPSDDSKTKTFILSSPNEKHEIIRYRLNRGDMTYVSGLKRSIVDGKVIMSPLPAVLDEKASNELKQLQTKVAVWAEKHLKNHPGPIGTN